MLNLSFIKSILSIVICFSITITNTIAQTNDDCFGCHDDHALTKLKNGKTISLFVNNKSLTKSVHKSVACIACHKDLKNAEFPHAENLQLVNCGTCHSTYETQVNSDVHHKLLHLSSAKTPTCKVCHGTHAILKPSTNLNKSKEYCGKCHTNNKLAAPYHTFSDVSTNCLTCHKKKDYKSELTKSVHSKLTCSNCHSNVINNFATHKKEPKGGPVADCYLCHNAIANEHKESIHGISLAEGINEAAQCWDCHGSHSITGVSSLESKVSPKNLITTCGKCHDDPAFSTKYSSAVKQPGKMYSLSVHGKLVKAGSKDAPTCATCHGIHNIKNRIQPESTISSIGLPNTCIKCHKQITEEYEQSIHWIAVKKGVRNAPTCNDCHSEHSIHAINTSTKRDEIIKIQQETCLKCHQDLILSNRYGMESGNASSYQDSYHGLAVTRGDKKAAMCIDCHGVHKILPKYHAESTINKKNITATCKKCHAKATTIFSNSYSHATEDKSFAGFIERLVRTVYFWLIIGVVAFMLLHNFIIFAYDIRERYKKEKNKIRLTRFTSNELIQHVVLLVSFTILAITGFQLKYPNSWWSEGLTYIGLDEFVRRIVHRTSAVIMIVLSVYHLFYVVFTSRGRAVILALFPNKSDFTQATDNILYYLHLKNKHPEFDYYDYIAKIEYWALIWGTIIMGATGLVLWFPTIVGYWAPLWFIKVSEIIHFYEAILATLAIVIWHWFFVIQRSHDLPISYTSVDGKITVDLFKEEHKLRFKKIIIEWLSLKNGTIDKNKISIFTKQFVDALEKQGVSMDDFIQSEMEKDNELKLFIEEQELKIK